MNCHPTSKFISCIIHATIDKQDDFFYIGYKRLKETDLPPIPTSSSLSSGSSSEEEEDDPEDPDTEGTVYTYRQTKLSNRSSLETIVVGCYNFNALGYTGEWTFKDKSGKDVRSDGLYALELTGETMIIKTPNAVEDNGKIATVDLSVTFKQVSYWNTGELKIAGADWIKKVEEEKNETAEGNHSSWKLIIIISISLILVILTIVLLLKSKKSSTS
jgi:hypothetical protein